VYLKNRVAVNDAQAGPPPFAVRRLALEGLLKFRSFKGFACYGL